jgi:hypothetical protein
MLSKSILVSGANDTSVLALKAILRSLRVSRWPAPTFQYLCLTVLARKSGKWVTKLHSISATSINVVIRISDDTSTSALEILAGYQWYFSGKHGGFSICIS